MIRLVLWATPLAIGWAAALQWIVAGWLLPDSYYSHGLLLPLVGAWAIWQQRGALRATAPSALGWPLLLVGLLAQLAGVALTVDSLSALALLPAVAGVLLLSLGRPAFRAALPLLGLLLLAVPLPVFVTGELAFWLKDLAARAATGLARLTGLAVEQSGARLFVPGCDAPMVVGDPCSGLRSLVALFTLGYCFAFFFGGPGALRRVALVVGGAVLALLANVLRLTVLLWVARGYGMTLATTTAHDLSNYLIYGVAILGLLFLDRWLPTRPEPTPAPAPVAPPRAARPAFAALLVLWLLALPLCWLSFTRPQDPAVGRAERIPMQLSGWQRTETFPLSERWFGLLGTRDVLWATYTRTDGRQANVIAVFHGANWKSVHPPHVCLRGDGFAIEADRREALTLAGVPAEIGWLLSSRGRTRILTAYAFGSAPLVTASYGRYFLHHVPRSLLRRPTSGFLLRIEAEVGDDEAAARAACLEVLAPALAAALEATR